ncbi:MULTISPECIES: hypothetical protein [unclassified Streptomyces]|uniref:hypothetical protein n=1 Tax=unclassified Streptomyces TaxID=2593676 RepID=UPI0013BEAB2D|nr:hypothetical protein [Streptomyces sp. CB09001]
MLPPSAVDSLTLTGPDWLSGAHGEVEVRWRPAQTVPPVARDAEVIFLDSDQQVTASYPATLSHLGRGSIGRSVDVELPGDRLQLMIPDTAGEPASLRYAYDLHRLEPAAAAPVLKMHRRFAVGGRFQVRADGHDVGGGDLPPQPAAVLDLAEQLLLYVEDLETVQRHCEQYFLVPGDLAASERIALRVARLLIEGHCAISPFVLRVHCTLDGQDSPTLRAVLENGPQPVHGVCQRLALTLAGRHLELGPVVFFHPRAVTEDGARLAAALDAGEAAGMELSMRPADGEHFRLLLQSLAPTAEPSAVPLNLAGFPEPR